MSRRLATLLATLLLLLCAAVAEAGPREVAQARTLTREGTKLYLGGEFAGALAAYRRAYALYPTAKLAYNLAQCHRKLKQYGAAIKAYREYLELAPDATNRAAVEQMLKKLAPLAEAESPAPPAEPPPAEVKPDPPLLPKPEAAPPAGTTPIAEKGDASGGPRWYRRWYVWTGIGAAGTFLIGVWFFGDPNGLGRWFGAALIVADVATLKLAH